MKGSDTINTTIVLKARLYLNEKQSHALRILTKRYSEVCNDVSRVHFENNMDLSQTKLHKLCYHYVRSHFGLKSQQTESSFKTVLARYRSVNTQMRRHVYHFRDNNTKQWYECFKDKHWLWKPIQFKRPQADLVANRDWRFSKDLKHLTLTTLGSPVKCDYSIPDYFNKYLELSHKFGTSKLLSIGKHWYFHISCTVSVPSFNYRKDTNNVVGIDRGLRFLTATYDNHKHSKFTRGFSIMKKREHFLHKRGELQSRGTKSAKRKLKRISGRENRWMTNINHQISKALVQHYGRRTTFVLEDLRGVRFSTEQVPKSLRYTQVSWAFYQLEQFLTYKAHLHQCEVVKVSPRYTSQRCPNCGHVLAQSRHHDIHTYICKYCGYTSNDDRIGAMNIRWLGIQKIHGKTYPKITPAKQVKPYQTSLF